MFAEKAVSPVQEAERGRGETARLEDRFLSPAGAGQTLFDSGPHPYDAGGQDCT